MGKNKEQILSILRENQPKLQRYGVKRLGIFGSVSRGEASKDSDLDFLVELETKSFDAYMGLKLFLEDLFQSKVDLVLENSIKPRLRETILREVVYATGL